jgi:hypothetical protein
MGTPGGEGEVAGDHEGLGQEDAESEPDVGEPEALPSVPFRVRSQCAVEQMLLVRVHARLRPLEVPLFTSAYPGRGFSPRCSRGRRPGVAAPRIPK